MDFVRPRIMGILNATPDSFYPGSRFMDAAGAVHRVGEMIAEGADFIDIGACSTRPGSEPPTVGEELRRLEEVVPSVRDAYPDVWISIDTFRAEVARECLGRWKVDVINDVSGGADPEMFSVVGDSGAAYVLMHSRGTAATMDTLCSYGSVVEEVTEELAFRLDAARSAGLCNVMVDPGFGFAKTPEQGLELLRRLDWLSVLGAPLLVGISRKRMAPTPAATAALDTLALERGAAVLRVHDVKEARQVIEALKL